MFTFDLQLFASITLPTTTGNTGPNLATTTLTRDSQTEHLQLMLFSDASGTTASVTAAGSNGVAAVAIQGINGGVNVPVLISTQATSGTLEASSAKTATGNGATVLAVSKFTILKCFLNLSATSGTGQTCQVYIQSQDPVSNNWVTIAQFSPMNSSTAINTPLTVDISATGPSNSIDFGANVRASWVIAGTTPSFTFSIGYVAK